jgi:hypothetical protein
MSEQKTCLITVFVPEQIASAEQLFFMEQFVPETAAARLGAVLGAPVCFSVPADYHGRLETAAGFYRRETALDDIANWQQLAARHSAGHVIRVFADSPFIDAAVIASMFRVHTDYLADFTFSENLPEGLGAEISVLRFCRLYPIPAVRAKPCQHPCGAYQQFDVELYYQEPDLRDRRLCFRSADSRECG